MENEDRKPKRDSVKSKGDKVTITPEGRERLQQWLRQLQPHFKAMRFTRTELVEWLIISRKPELTSREIKDIKSRYHNEVHLAKWILQQVRKANKEGQPVRVQDLLGPKTEAGVNAHKRERAPGEVPSRTKEQQE